MEQPDPGILELHRLGAAHERRFVAPEPVEGILHVRVGAPQADWSRTGAECALVRVEVDGRYVSDIVVPTRERVDRSVQLGRLDPGTHVLALGLDGQHTPSHVDHAIASSLRVELIGPSDPRWMVVRHAPILHGRALAHLGSPFQNATGDAPLFAWHGRRPSPVPGRTLLEYSMLWTHEDEGTSAPALMARWGRTTDIEWIYRIEIDGAGRAVPGTSTYQGPEHTAMPFEGGLEHDHPLLQTATGNNNVTDIVDSPMRFSPAADLELPPGSARETIMLRHPWLYGVMRGELAREGHLGPQGRTTIPDPRSFVFVQANVSRGGDDDRISFLARLAGDRTRYRSDLGSRDLAVHRDGAVQVAIPLPVGATPNDLVELTVETSAGRGERADTTVALRRAFWLDEHAWPVPAIDGRGAKHRSTSLGSRAAILWRRQPVSAGGPAR